MKGKGALVTGGSRGVRSGEIVADVPAPADVRRMVDEAASSLGRLDVVVANAGGSRRGGLLEATDEDWQFTLDINLMHAVRTIRASVPHFRRSGGGSVVLISSASGFKAAR